MEIESLENSSFLKNCWWALRFVRVTSSLYQLGPLEVFGKHKSYQNLHVSLHILPFS